MPRKTQKDQGEKKGVWNFQFEGFISCSLNDEQRGMFYEWEKTTTPEVVLGAIHSLVEHGYKFTWSLGGNNNSCIATLTCNNPLSPDKGWALSGFADELWQATYVLLFKHQVVLSGSWLANGKATSNRGGIG